jgi:thiamine-phosphate pyrophosphorylase
VFLVAGDWRLACRVRADGLHLPEGLARHGRQDWRRARRPGFLVTQAAHGMGALALAARLGVDAAIASPVFPTASHPGASALGAVRFARLVRMARLPVYALGGIDAVTARRLAASGAAGVAAVSWLARPASRTTAG